VQFEVEVRELQARETEMQMCVVEMIWKEDGGVLSGLVDGNSDGTEGRRRGGSGSRLGVSRAVDRATGWVRRARAGRTIGL
jgi:hypothetical protein